MAFDYTNNLETAAQANPDFDFTDRAGNASDTVKSANTAGEWCEENGSTTSSGTGPSANPTGRAGFIYTETSTPSASTVWAMKRNTSFNASTQNVTLNLIYNLNAETASDVFIEYATVASPNETTDWTIFETIPCTLTDSWISDSFDFSAQTTTTLWLRVRCSTDNNFTNDIAFSTWNEVGVDSAGISSIDPTEFDMDAADVDINGQDFEATQGTGDVYLSDANTLAGSANEVDITSAVNTWSDTVVNLDLTQLSASELDDLHTLGPGQRYVILVNNSSDEYGSDAITLHRPAPAVMSLSTNFAPGSTTQRLTGLTGTFAGGRIEEALNPSTTNTDVADNGNREDVANIQMTAGSREVSYVARVLYGGNVPDTITTTPTITVSAGASLVVDSGSYTWTGQAASLKYGSLVAANAGSYAWTGQTASLEFGSLVAADSGSYTWTGQDASFLLDTAVVAEAGSYVWTGQDASLELGALVSAEAGSYSWTGQDASLEFGAAVVAEAGSYAWTGQDASLEFGSLVSAEAASYAWTGATASLEFGAVLNAEATSYVWTGQEAFFPSGLQISAESGSYVWTGQTASLELSALISAEAASYSWTGQDASLEFGTVISAESGSYSWSGTDASLEFASLVTAEPGSFAWTGATASLLAGSVITAESVAYVWTGADADLIYAAGLTLIAEAGSYNWTGADVTLHPSSVQAAGAPCAPKKKHRYILPDGQVITDPVEAYAELERQLRARAAELDAEKSSPQRRKRKRSRSIHPKKEPVPLLTRSLPQIIERLPEVERAKIDMGIVEAAQRLAEQAEEEEQILALLVLAA